jgi:hypothetical protein
LTLKVFNCPQCGASLEYEQITSATVKCHYCNSLVVVPAELRPAPARPEPDLHSTFRISKQPNKVLPVLITVLLLAFIGLIIIGLASRSNKPRTIGAIPNYTPYRAPTPAPTPAPNGYTIAFTFGQEGTGPGFFKDEMGVGVDGEGRIYVSDETRRVQRFDESGKFIDTWNIPAQTKWYSNLKGGPHKILVNNSGEVYAVLAGVVLKLNGATGEALGAANDSDYIDDATLLPDGGMLIVSEKGKDDELVHLGGDGRAARRTHRFVSSILDKELEVEALRVAADGAGNTFALYAIGGVAGEHYYDDEDIAVFKFTPDGKYVTRFGGEGREPGQYGPPTTFAVDNESRVYVCESFDKIHVFTGDGRYVRTLEVPHAVDALTFDAQNNLYIAGGYKVSKLVLDK